MRWVVLVLVLIGDIRAQVEFDKERGYWLIRDVRDLQTIEYWGRKVGVCDSVLAAIHGEMETLKKIGRVRDSISIELQRRVQDSRELLGGLGSDLQASRREEERLKKDVKRLEGELRKVNRRRVVEGIGIGAIVGLVVWIIRG